MTLFEDGVQCRRLSVDYSGNNNSNNNPAYSIVSMSGRPEVLVDSRSHAYELLGLNVCCYYCTFHFGNNFGKFDHSFPFIF